MNLSRHFRCTVLAAGFAALLASPTMAATAVESDIDHADAASAPVEAQVRKAAESVAIPRAERAAMVLEIEGILEAARLDVAALIADGDEASEQASRIKTQAWADVYRTQARYSREAGLTDQADELDRLAENILNPVVPEVDPAQLRSARRAAE